MGTTAITSRTENVRKSNLTLDVPLDSFITPPREGKGFRGGWTGHPGRYLEAGVTCSPSPQNFLVLAVSYIRNRSYCHKQHRWRLRVKSIQGFSGSAGHNHRMREMPSAGRVAPGGGTQQSPPVSRGRLLGASYPRFRRSGCRSGGHRTGTGGTWGKSDGPHVYRRSQRRLAFRGAPPL